MIPIGAAVREKSTGKLGKRVRVARVLPRGFVAIQFDNETKTRQVHLSNVDYVAKRYDVAKTWIAAGKSL